MLKKIFILFFVGCISYTNAQTDDAAKKLLNEVSKKYSSYKTIQSDFELTATDANKKSYTNKGVMFFNKPKKQYAFKLQDQEIISDGKSVWSIAKDIKEVQISEAEENSSTIGPTNLFTFYQTGYKYISMDDEKITKQGKSEKVRVVELSPLSTKTNYFKIKLRINQNNHIHDVTIFDKSNNKYTYTIHSLYLGKNLGNEYFTFKKENYNGYEIVDLR